MSGTRTTGRRASSGPDGVTESYGYDADGARVSRARAGVTTVYLAGAWEQDVQGGASATTRAFVTLQGRAIAQRERVAGPPATDTCPGYFGHPRRLSGGRVVGAWRGGR